jgi:hypothetical protein
VAVAAGSGSGLTSGSGSVAVAGEDGRWQCGHFDRWQVDNPFFVAVAVWQCGNMSGRVAI